MKTSVVLLFLVLGLTCRYVSSFKSDELPEDDEEWGFVGRETGSTFGGGRGERVAQGGSSNEGDKRRSGSTTAAPTSPAVDASGDKKIQFDLEHSFGDSEFTPAGSFSARLRASTHGRQTLSKLRLTRNAFSEFQENAFKELVQQDGFYKVRIPANVIDPGKTYVMASIKARCLAAASLKERFDLNLDQGNVIGITYSSGADCTYPRPQVFLVWQPSDWTFNSWIVSKSSEQAMRVTPMFEDTPLENLVTGEDGLPTKVVEKNFWQKYWMYIIPFGLILVNAITSIANMPEEPAGGQGAAPAGAVPQRIAGAGGARRR